MFYYFKSIAIYKVEKLILPFKTRGYGITIVNLVLQYIFAASSHFEIVMVYYMFQKSLVMF